MSASSSSIQLRGPRFALDAHRALSAVDDANRCPYLFDIARQVLDAVSDEERTNVYVVAAYDLCAVTEQVIGESNQLRALCNVVAARILLRGRVPADGEQKMGSLTAGAAWALLGASPLCAKTRVLELVPDECVSTLLKNFGVALDSNVTGAVKMHELTAAIGSIIGSIVDGELLFSPQPQAASQ